MAISVPSTVFDIYFEAVDYMIDTLFTTDCKITYPPLKIECENCYFNTMPGVGATNRYRTGGPYPFEDGVCPYCNGLGFKLDARTETIKVRAYYDLKSWTKFNPKIAYKNGSAVIIGHIRDLPKFQHMANIQLNTDLVGYTNLKFEMTSDPLPWGFQPSQYFTTNVERISGEQ